MRSLYTSALLRTALSCPMDAQLHGLLTAQANHLGIHGLADLTHIVVIEGADTEADLQREVGFSPLDNPQGHVRFDQPGFCPAWDRLQDHGGWIELLFTVGNDGFAFIVLIDGQHDLAAAVRAIASASLSGEA